MKKLIVIGLAMVAGFSGKAQLTVDNTSFTPYDLVVNYLVGSGVTVSNVTYNGIVGGGPVNNTIGYFTSTGTPVGIPSGVIMGTGNVQVAIGPNTMESASLGGGAFGASDADLELASGDTYNDAAVLEFDFIPTGDSINFKYVFASEEYPEYVFSVNDAFGFFLSGPGISGPYSGGAENIALVPGTSTFMSINSVNDGNHFCSGGATGCTNCAYYVSNCGGTTIQYDGMTVTVIAKAKVQCGMVYHIKLVIADALDTAWDSAVFLQEGSFSSNDIDVSIATPTSTSFINGAIYEECILGTTATFYLVRPTTSSADTIPFAYTGSAIVGLDYTSSTPDTFAIFAVGEDTASFSVTILGDGVTEGVDSLVVTVYNINLCGDTIVSSGTLYIHDPLVIVASAGLNDTINCLSEVVNLTGSATGSPLDFTYAWSGPGLTASGLTATFTPGGDATVIFSAVDECGFGDTDTMQITYVPIPVIADAGGDTTICPGFPMVITGSAIDGTSPFNYTWTQAGTTLSTTATLTYSPPATQDVVLTVVDNCGQSDSDTVTINVIVPTPFDLTFDPIETVACPGYPVAMDVVVNAGGIPPYTYLWDNGDVDNIGNYSVFTSPTTATLQINDNCGADTTITITMNVQSYSPLVVSTVDGELCLNTSGQVELPVTVTGGAGSNAFEWFAPVGPTITYNTSVGTALVSAPVDGNYVVAVIDLCGNTDLDTATISVIPCEITIPNIITPNGDNTNDAFYIINLEYHPNSSVVIFNRWGQLLYENADYKNDYKPTDWSDGVYYYVVKLTDGTEPAEYSGAFQLMKNK